jgi:hypothetical protein
VLSIHLWLPFEKKEEIKVKNKNCLLRFLSINNKQLNNFFTVKPALTTAHSGYR